MNDQQDNKYDFVMPPAFTQTRPALNLQHILKQLKINPGTAARQLGVSRTTFSRVLNGKASISTEMAIRLELWLDCKIDAYQWLECQINDDLNYWYNTPGRMPQNVTPLEFEDL